MPYLARLPKRKAGKQKAIILLHGVGSNEQDLFGLAPLLPEDFLVISARGPFIIGTDRYAWYEVNFSTGRPVINAEQEERSRNVLKAFIRQIKNTYAVDELYLGGFSQGAIMSYSLGLTCPDEITGILSLSGRILTQIQPLVQPSKALQGLKVFIAHGLQDGTLPVFYAREAKEYLQQIGVELSYHEFEIGHQINGQVLEEIRKWLQE